MDRHAGPRAGRIAIADAAVAAFVGVRPERLTRLFVEAKDPLDFFGLREPVGDVDAAAGNRRPTVSRADFRPPLDRNLALWKGLDDAGLLPCAVPMGAPPLRPIFSGQQYRLENPSRQGYSNQSARNSPAQVQHVSGLRMMSGLSMIPARQAARQLEHIPCRIDASFSSSQPPVQRLRWWQAALVMPKRPPSRCPSWIATSTCGIWRSFVSPGSKKVRSWIAVMSRRIICRRPKGSTLPKRSTWRSMWRATRSRPRWIMSKRSVRPENHRRG